MDKLKTDEEYLEWQTQSDGEMEELEDQLVENFELKPKGEEGHDPEFHVENAINTYRKTHRHLINVDAEPWFINILMHYANVANRSWHADIQYVGQAEYLVYDKPNDHYEWHIDGDIINQRSGMNQRKLTCIIQLSDHDEYRSVVHVPPRETRKWPKHSP